MIANEIFLSRVSKHSPGYILVSDSAFIECISRNSKSSGGALSISGNNQYVTLSRVGFRKCFSVYFAGAFYCKSNISNIYEICFNQCSAPKYFDYFSECDQLNINSTLSSNGSFSNIGQSIFGLSGKINVLRNLNYTDSYSPLDAALMTVQNISCISVQYLYAFNLTGNSCNVFHSKCNDIIFASSLFSNLNLTDSPLFLIRSQLFLKNCYFNISSRIVPRIVDADVILHDCFILGNETQWKEFNSNIQALFCLFIPNFDCIPMVSFKVEQFWCWYVGANSSFDSKIIFPKKDDLIPKAHENQTNKVIHWLVKGFFLLIFGSITIYTFLIFWKPLHPHKSLSSQRASPGVIL